MKLNARQVETAKPKEKTYKMADGGGLYLEVSAKGSKYWRMKYRRPSDKKEDRLAFGVWPMVTLAQARAKRDEAKKLLVQGIDPKAEQKEAQAENSGAYTFETIAREWHASNKRWSEDHRSRILRYLELYIFPHIGSSDIRQLKTSHLLAPIKKVDASGKQPIVLLQGYQMQGSENTLYLAAGQRLALATLSEEGIKALTVNGEWQADEYGNQWRQASLQGALTDPALADRKPLWQYAEKLDDTYCAGCHAPIAADHYTVNAWPSIAKGMGARTSMSENELDILTRYFQYNAKDITEKQ
ncbi:integrase arm-type DNA-binding domain-containing protein [Escherichia coli]|uniref:integrase arm-type DNA-binding domain-containing protein n=1 Tax=Escherichia coli TaxID=562 RepID=UPI00065037B5|nr:integrase arm-type DNA-binding domain-containing protein [Escherichia coli]TWQ21513.1 DUF4102 domain-containing protein [Escherichia coli]